MAGQTTGNNMGQQTEYLTTSQVSRRVHRCERQVRRYASDGVLTAERTVNGLRFPLTADNLETIKAMARVHALTLRPCANDNASPHPSTPNAARAGANANDTTRSTDEGTAA